MGTAGSGLSGSRACAAAMSGSGRPVNAPKYSSIARIHARSASSVSVSASISSRRALSSRRRCAKTSASSASRVGKWRYSVPAPTPASLAIASRDVPTP